SMLVMLIRACAEQLARWLGRQAELQPAADRWCSAGEMRPSPRPLPRPGGADGGSCAARSLPAPSASKPLPEDTPRRNRRSCRTTPRTLARFHLNDLLVQLVVVQLMVLVVIEAQPDKPPAPEMRALDEPFVAVPRPLPMGKTAARVGKAPSRGV